MADINDGKPIAFEQGGKIALTDSGTEHVFVNRERGTLQVEDGGYEVLEWHDRGTPKLPREGSGQYSTVRLSLKLTKLEATSLVSLSKKRAAAPGDVYEYTSLVITFPIDKGLAAGTKRTYTGVFFARPAVIREGQELDTIELEMKSILPLGTDAAHS